MTNTTPAKKAERSSHLTWVPLSEMKVSPRAQQKFRPAHAEMIAADFNIEALGFLVVSHRDGAYYIMDGQHRAAAAKIHGYGDQQLQCECYEGLTEEEEAEIFLERNTRKEPPAFEKFRIAITAGRLVECEIERVLRANGFVLSLDNLPGAVSAVATLKKVYDRAGSTTMAKSLRIVRDSYGDAALTAQVIEGVGLLCQRYNGELPAEPDVTKRLGAINGGVNGLLVQANLLHAKFGGTKANAVAGAAVDVLNRGRRGPKLKSWWAQD